MPMPCNAASSLGRFGLELGTALDCLGGPLKGLVVVLSPVWVRDAKQWHDDVAALVERPELQRVRWVIVDLDESICASLAGKLEDAALLVNATLDVAEAQREIDAMTAASASAPQGAEGMRVVGMAGPDEPPPKRKMRPPGLTGEEAQAVAKEKGLPEVMLRIGPMSYLRGLVLNAARAMSKGEASRAVAIMRDARRFCRESGLTRLVPMMGLMMGGYAMQARAPLTAAVLFREARADAESAGAPELVAQAQMAIAAGLLASNKNAEAALAFAEAGKLAADAGARVIAIEAYRTAGEILVGERDFEHAAGAFWRAVQISSDAELQEWRISSAPEAARALSRIFREHGNDERAVWLERLAIEMETLGESEKETVVDTRIGEEARDAGCYAV